MKKMKLGILGLLLAGNMIVVGCASTAATPTANETPIVTDTQNQVNVQATEQEKELAVESVIANCKPSTYGVVVDNFELEVNDASLAMGVAESDFSMINAAVTDASWSDELKVTDVSFKSDSVILTVEPFYLSCSYSEYQFWNMEKEPDENGLQFDFAPGDFEVKCASNDKLNFTYQDIKETKTELVDDFADMEENGTQYKMFTPENAEGPVPVVIYNHGGGCAAYGRQIIDDPYATSFVKDSVQDYYKCYVIAPYYEEKNIAAAAKDRANIVNAVKKLIDEGKADASKIYVCGESFGSVTTFTYLYENPGFFAAAVPMDGGPSLNDDGTIIQGDENWGNCFDDAALKQLAESDTAVMLVQGIGDPLSFPDKYAAVYKKLTEYGMDSSNLVWESYTGEEFNYLQNAYVAPTQDLVIDPISGKTTYVASQYHNSSRAAAGDTYLKNWLFRQSLSE